MIAMLVVGIVLLFVFTLWDTLVAKRPVMPGRFLRNRSFIGAAWIGFFDFVSVFVTGQAYSLIRVSFNRSLST